MNPCAATPLTPERWRRIETIFHAVLDIAEQDRADFLLNACQGDEDLRVELQRLMLAFEDERRFRPPAAAIGLQGRVEETIGGYKLDRELGQGGMGTVYLAHRVDGEFEQQVALKVVSAHLRTSFFTERFRAERQILAGLNHPNITRLLDGGVSTSGDPYLVMEYVDGRAIDRYCDERILAVPERLRLFLQACSAVEYAHRNLVVHRDLKPGNLLVTKDGTTKLLDFGTAKLILTAPAETATTRFHAMTVRYASPEQLRSEPVSTSMDVYSLGVMLYELTVGAWPFGNPDSAMAGLERAVRDIAPSPPRSLITDEAARRRSTSKAKLVAILDGDLRSVILKAMEAEPRRRYTSVEQLSADLRHYLAGEPVQAREHTLLYRGARFVQRHRWRVAAGAALGTVLAISTLTAVQQYGREQRRMVQVRNLSQSYLTDILNEVGKLPGSMKARLMIVDRARRNLDQLLPDAPNDADLRRALATAYLQLGDIQGKPFTVSLGDTSGALESYRKAETLAAHAGPKDWELLADLVRARRVIAQIDTRAGRDAEALALLNSSLDPAKRLWLGAPLDFKVDGKPAGALYVETNLTLGYTMMKALDNAPISAPGLRQALAQLRRSVSIAEQVQAAYPDMPDMAGRCSEYVGFALEGLAEATGDAEYFRESVAAHRRSADAECRNFHKDPGPQTQRGCADALGELSWALHRAGDGEPGVQAASQSLALMRPVSAAEPNSLEAQMDLTAAYLHLGAAESTAGKLHEAIGDLRTAESRILLLRQNAANDSLETAGLYVDIERELADALLASHKATGVIEVLEKAIPVAERTAKSKFWLPYMRGRIDQARALQAASSPSR
jgi:eukaryotic-like serine/threonine-protein kinase